MKIKDLPSDARLAGVIFLHPTTGERCEFVSAWRKGVWWRAPGSGPVSEVHPIQLAGFEDVLELEVAP